MASTNEPREQTGVEDWLDGIKAIYSSPTKSTLTKITMIAMNPVILSVLALIAVLIFYVVRCRTACPECPVGATTATSE
jgi:hypothetical protein